MGKNFNKPGFRMLTPPLNDMFMEASKESGLKSGQMKVANVLVAGKHDARFDSTYRVQDDPFPFGIKFSPNTVTTNPGTLLAGDTDVMTGAGITVKDSLIDAGVLCTVPEENQSAVSTAIPGVIKSPASVMFGTTNSQI